MSFIGVVLVYNEEEFIEFVVRQHAKYFDRFLVIDGCDRRNLDKNISKSGLSNDKTLDILYRLKEEYKNLEIYKMPFATKEDKANFYITKLKDGDVFVRIDCDEFYTFYDLEKIKELSKGPYDCIIFPIFNFWKDIRHVIKGNMFDVSHCKVFKYYDGSNFKYNHVVLSYQTGKPYGSERERVLYTNDVICYHTCFCRKDIVRYKINLEHYVYRGEEKTRPAYIECRKAFVENRVPRNCEVFNYEGEYPEVFYKLYYKEIFANKQNTNDSVKQIKEKKGDINICQTKQK